MPETIPPPRALFIDLDGTLVDSERDIAEAVNATLTALRRPALPIDVILPMIGDGARMLVRRALGTDGEDEALVDEAATRLLELYAERPCVHTTLMPGARELIGLHGETSARIPCALFTNKPRTIACLILEQLGVAHAFGAVYAGGDGPLKPSPHGVFALAKALDLEERDDGSRIWVIGDGPQDILAGRAAHCFTVAVPGIAAHDRVAEAKPDISATSLLEVATLVRRALGPTSA